MLEAGSSLRSRNTAIYVERRVRLEGELGRGGMGTVFAGVDEDLERIVAIKFLLPELQSAPDMVGRFRREAKATAAISHRNVVKIYSCGRNGSTDYFISEYIDGFSLQELLERCRREGSQLPLSCALFLLDQVCQGLQAVHEAGIVHRDIKPGNVMIEAETGRVVIMDFGIGAPCRAEGEDLESTGTPAYMAPEVITGQARECSAGPLADLYSLGVTAYETLTSRLPFDSESWVDTLHRHLTEAPAPPSTLRPELSPALDAAVLRCLEKSPGARYGSCVEFHDVLSLIRRRGLGSSPPELDERDTLKRSVLSSVERARAVEALSRVVTVALDPEQIVVVQEGLRRLTPRGEVLAARTISKALELCRRHSARVLIAPLTVGEVSGLELAALLRALGGAKLIVTALSISDDDRQRLDRGGIAAVLLAPLGPEEVGRALLHAALSSW